MASAFVPKRLYAGAVPTTAPSAPFPYVTPSGTATQIRAIQFTTNTAGSSTPGRWGADHRHLDQPGRMPLDQRGVEQLGERKQRRSN